VKLTFTWAVEAPDRIVGTCAGCVNEHGISPICLLLSDNGGFLDDVSLPYFEDGIALIDAVLRGEVATESWIREWLEAEFDARTVRIYAMDDEESYRQTMSTADFRRAMVAWRDFIKAGPQDNAQVEVEIADP
jgi:hypothetical protein